MSFPFSPIVAEAPLSTGDGCRGISVDDAMTETGGGVRTGVAPFSLRISEVLLLPLLRMLGKMRF